MEKTAKKGARIGAKKLDMQQLLAPAALVILYIFFCIASPYFAGLSYLQKILESELGITKEHQQWIGPN